MADINLAIDYMYQLRASNTRYSMELRHVNGYEDCSSAVLRALKYAGFYIPTIGNTDTLFAMEGNLLLPISRSQLQKGDVFVSGDKGYSGGSAGHTGFALNATQAIHMTASYGGGVAITSNADSVVGVYGKPVYWYRVAGSSSNPTPSPAPIEEDEIVLDEDFVDHEYLQSVFGIRVDTWEFDNVLSQRDLRQKTLDRMNQQLETYHETTATLLELGIIDDSFDLVEVGNSHYVYANGLSVNGSQRIVKQSINFLEPQKTTVTFGSKFKTVVDFLAEGGTQ